MSQAIETLVREFERLPGIGRKTAQRLTYYLLKLTKEEAASLADAIKTVKEKIITCSNCANLTEIDPCEICRDGDRDDNIICVLEEASAISAIEKTGEYRGKYHILQGSLSPLDGIGPDELNIHQLLKRLEGNSVNEVIVATNPNVEGEATALYLKNTIKPLGIKVTRLARGLPVGGDIEYADEVTISQAIEGRREIL